MNIAAISFSNRGHALAKWLAIYFNQSGDNIELTRCKSGELTAWTRDNFSKDALIFIGSCGIAVRAIAPFLKDKTADPAVIVIDDLARHTISLLSGHIGGANALTKRIARYLNSDAVITTSTDLHKVFAVDTWAANQGISIANPKHIKKISSLLLSKKAVRLQSCFPISGPLPKGMVLCKNSGDLILTYRALGNTDALRLIPPVVTLGIGCRKGTDVGTIERIFAQFLSKSNCHPLAVAQVCSIDLKESEAGILEFCRTNSFLYNTFTAEELMSVEGQFNSSAFVKQVTGADNICERSALLGSGANGRLIAEKFALNGVTMALALSPYTVTFNSEAKL